MKRKDTNCDKMIIDNNKGDNKIHQRFYIKKGEGMSLIFSVTKFVGHI